MALLAKYPKIWSLDSCSYYCYVLIFENDRSIILCYTKIQPSEQTSKSLSSLSSTITDPLVERRLVKSFADYFRWAKGSYKYNLTVSFGKPCRNCPPTAGTTPTARMPPLSPVTTKTRPFIMTSHLTSRPNMLRKITPNIELPQRRTTTSGPHRRKSTKTTAFLILILFYKRTGSWRWRTQNCTRCWSRGVGLLQPLKRSWKSRCFGRSRRWRRSRKRRINSSRTHTGSSRSTKSRSRSSSSRFTCSMRRSTNRT